MLLSNIQTLNQLISLNLKYALFLIPFLLLKLGSYGQGKNRINVGVEFGTSRMMVEFPADFSQKIVEFDNKPGFTTDAELTKYISDRWEIGIDLNYTTLNGNKQHPSFSAEGNHSAIKELEDKPVEYINRLLGQKVFTRFYLTPLDNVKGKVNNYPFIGAGAGIINYQSKFKYIGEDDIIFGKGYRGFTKLSTAVFSLSAGIKTSWSSKLFVVSSVNSNFVSYGFLDAMHNYNAAGNKLDILGLFLDFKVGIFYGFPSISETKKMAKRKKEIKKKKSKPAAYLPFSNKN